MIDKRDLSLDFSIIYRTSQKFFDKALDRFNLGYGNLLILLKINEKPGISMNELARLGSFDKGTITKMIQRLVELGYIKAEPSSLDKRGKDLYLTDEAVRILPEIYMIRQRWWEYLRKGIDDDMMDTYLCCLNQMINNARDYFPSEERQEVRFFGIQKLTLLDYPGHMASTLFTGGCNFKCPFCHNRDLVFLDEKEVELDKEEILNFLSSRKNILDGVCISGGEPLLQPDLKAFILDVRALGLKVKLDTNGSNYSKLKELIEEGLVDYVAMDVKNDEANYAKTCGVGNVDLSAIRESVELLKQNHVDYEFRTTIVKEFHDSDSIEAMGRWLKGAKILYLQSFEDNENVIQQGLHPHDRATINEFKRVLEKYIAEVKLRGIE